jgi:hypothetical protein
MHEEDDMDVEVSVDFTKPTIKTYNSFSEKTYAYCNHLLETNSGGSNLNNCHLEEAIASLSNAKLPHYK